MLSFILGIIGVALGLLVFYVRVMSVVIDERNSVDKDKEASERHALAVRMSEKLEVIWPIVKPWQSTSWAGILSNVAMLITFALLFFAGEFKDYLSNYAGTLLIMLFFLSSISNGPKSIEKYHKIKPYLPIILPALTYQGLSMLESSHPAVISTLVFPGLTYQETKVIGTALALSLIFIIPYPLARFDAWFSSFIAKSTLFFLKDLMRLGVKALDQDEVGLRKIAKETVSFTLRVLLALFATIIYLTRAN